MKFDFMNTKVASVEATVKFLEYIPSDKLKKALIAIIETEGLTFNQENFISKITDKYTKETINDG